MTSLLPDALCTKPTGNTALETVTLTPALVVAFPVGSFATAVSVWTPLADKVVFQSKVYGLPVRSPLRAVVPSRKYCTLATLTLSFAVAATLIVAVTACLVPARRATRVDPVIALRAE